MLYLKTAVIQLTFVKRSDIYLMVFNDFNLVSRSDSYTSEIDRRLGVIVEVEGLPKLADT